MGAPGEGPRPFFVPRCPSQRSQVSSFPRQAYFFIPQASPFSLFSLPSHPNTYIVLFTISDRILHLLYSINKWLSHDRSTESYTYAQAHDAHRCKQMQASSRRRAGSFVEHN